jgi:AAA domain
MSDIPSAVAKQLEDSGHDGDYDLAELSAGARQILSQTSVSISRAKSRTEILDAVYLASVALMQFDLHPDRDIVIAHLSGKARGLFGVTRDDIQSAVARGVQDVLERRGAAGERGAEADRQPRPAQSKSTWRDETIGAQDLCDQVFPPMKWIIPDLFPEGVTLLVSRPKLGKSWLLQQIGSAIANGVRTLVATDEPADGDTLYLNLEDGYRRAQRRMTKYFGALRDTWPRRLTIARAWKHLDKGGVEDLREWCKSVSKPTLIMIDTLKKVRAPKRPGQTDYAADYEACEGLIKLAHEFPGLGIIVSSHDRKLDADDVFDTVSGTLGLTGGVDAIAILKRNAQGVTLHVQGRDLLDTVEKAVRFDRETCRWTILGEAAEVTRSETRQAILAAVSARRMRPKEIAEITKIDGNTVRQQIFKMMGSGELEKVGDFYQRPTGGGVTPVTA